MDFGDFALSGRFPAGQVQNTTLFGVFELLKSLDLSASSLVDIGTYDGLVAFGARKLGAQTVIGVDTYDRPTFRLARKILNLEDDVQYEPRKQIRDLPNIFKHKSLDVIVCAGVIYHMFHPMQAFVYPRFALRDGGYLIMETPFDASSDQAHLIFNGVEKAVNEPYKYFVASRSALIGMAHLSGFSVKAIRTLKPLNRITLLLRASSREELIEDQSVAPFTKQMLKRDTCDDEFRFKDLEALPASTALVSERRIHTFERAIDPQYDQPGFPLHPPMDRPSFGSTRFETKHGNLKEL
ncbi:MAG: class I SAM-dependent methyltransferase [Pseudomonadota bacterium]